MSHYDEAFNITDLVGESEIPPDFINSVPYLKARICLLESDLLKTKTELIKIKQQFKEWT